MVSFFGTIASFERAAYSAAVTSVLNEIRPPEKESVPLFVSRPFQCQLSYTTIGVPPDPILENLADANVEGSRPISLATIGHLVATMPWEGNYDHFRAGYLKLQSPEFLFLSRVGFDFSYSRAAVCLWRWGAPHGNSVIVVMERSGLDWVVVDRLHGRIAI